MRTTDPFRKLPIRRIKDDALLKTTWWRLSIAQLLTSGVILIAVATVTNASTGQPGLYWRILGAVIGILLSQILVGILARCRCTLRLFKGRIFLGSQAGIPVRDLDLDTPGRTSWLMALWGFRRICGNDGRHRMSLHRLWYSPRDLAAFLDRCRAEMFLAGPTFTAGARDDSLEQPLDSFFGDGLGASALVATAIPIFTSVPPTNAVAVVGAYVLLLIAALMLGWTTRKLLGMNKATRPRALRKLLGGISTVVVIVALVLMLEMLITWEPWNRSS